MKSDNNGHPSTNTIGYMCLDCGSPAKVNDIWRAVCTQCRMSYSILSKPVNSNCGCWCHVSRHKSGKMKGRSKGVCVECAFRRKTCDC